MRAYAVVAAVLLCAGCVSSARLQSTRGRWGFNDLEEWQNDCARMSPASYVTTNGLLHISTRERTRDRVKVRTRNRFGAGTYTWRIYVPEMGEGDQASIGAFLYKDDKHELDFEIGYGKKKVRAELGAEEDDVVCYCSSQGNPYSSSQLLLTRGMWHKFTLEVLPGEEGNYHVKWSIDDKQMKRLQTRFGGEVSFTIHCSVENLLFMGDHIPARENYALFDYVVYEPGD